MARTIGYLGIGLSGVVALLSILAVSLPYWQVGEVTTFVRFTVDVGLWKICVDNRSGYGVCYDVDSINLYYYVTDTALRSNEAVRAMLMLAIFLSAAATIAGILVLFVMKDKKSLYFFAAGLDVGAGLFLMIGMAVYADNVKADGFDLHAAFALDVLGWLLAWGAGGVFVTAKFVDKD